MFISSFTLFQILLFFGFHSTATLFSYDSLLFFSFRPTTTSLCCSFHEITFTSLTNFLFFFPSNTTSISILHPPAPHVFATHISFSSRTSSNLLLFTFLFPIPSPPSTHFPTGPLKFSNKKRISIKLHQVPFTFYCYHKNELSLCPIFCFVAHTNIFLESTPSLKLAQIITLTLFLLI